MGQTMSSQWWNVHGSDEKEHMFVNELEVTLEALDYIVKRIWPSKAD